MIAFSGHLRQNHGAMTNEPENPAPVPTPQAPTPAEQSTLPRRRTAPPRPGGWRGIVEALWDSFCDWLGLSPLNQHIKRERARLRVHLRKVVHLFVFFVLLSLIVGFAGGYCLRGCGVDRQYGFLNGKLSASQDENHRLEKQLEDSKQEIIKRTVESNEVKREKDDEILRISGERNTAQQRLSYYETHSPQLLNLLSNLSSVYGIETTNREPFLALKELLEGISTNLSHQLTQSPSFYFLLNDIRITNNASITIPATNASWPLTFAVYNNGNATADGVTIAVSFPKELPVLPPSVWGRIAQGGLTDNGKMTYRDYTGYGCEDSRLLRVGAGVVFQPFTIQGTNLNTAVYGISICAASKNFAGITNLALIHFVGGTGEPHLGF
jgi:hypothetical protein